METESDWAKCASGREMKPFGRLVSPNGREMNIKLGGSELDSVELKQLGGKSECCVVS
jgi:hypothetical protein